MGYALSVPCPICWSGWHRFGNESLWGRRPLIRRPNHAKNGAFSLVLQLKRAVFVWLARSSVPLEEGNGQPVLEAFPRREPEQPGLLFPDGLSALQTGQGTPGLYA